MYKCPRCKYETNHKTNIKNHFNRKRLCESDKDNEISIEECLKLLNKGILKSKEKIKHICEYCNKEFNRQTRLCAHIIKCKIKDDIILKQQEEIELLKELLNETKQNITNNTNNTNCNNTNNSTTNNIYITINSYKDTDYTAVKDKIHQCIMNNGDVDMEKLIELVHFNKDIPQNHNIYVTNSKTKRVMKFNGNNFIEDGKGNDGLEEVFNDKLKDIEEHQDLDDDIKIAVDVTWTNYNNKNDKERNKILNKIYKPLYNNKEIVIKREKQLKIKNL